MNPKNVSFHGGHFNEYFKLKKIKYIASKQKIPHINNHINV
jgi:hypothetical protein